MSALSTCLWFDDEAEEAASFYVSVFKDGKIGAISRYATETPSEKPIGSVLTVEFEINGRRFLALNGGPPFKFNEAVSLVIECADQSEIDYYWDMLSAVPEAEQCGWLKDRYGLSWQVVPNDMAELMAGSDPERAARVMAAILKMKKLSIDELKSAYGA
jgi:predicted 3-demethylubiquinone-9 3-methyltransferase (glyoxalase superfamily)